MEITKEAIIEAIGSKPELVEQILPNLVELEPVKKTIENKANLIYQEKFDSEIKNVHSRYDQDVLEILGEAPGTKEDGAKEKTYELTKRLFSELKDLRNQKDSLSKDEKVKELQSQIAKLQNEGGGKHVQEMFDQARQEWITKETEYKSKLSEAMNQTTNFQKTSEIESAFAKLKFDAKVPDSLKKMVIDNVKKQLVSNSKIEEGKLIFLDNDGKPMVDSVKYEPKDAFQVLSSIEAIKDILEKEPTKGGGASTDINGNIHTITGTDGKSSQKLVFENTTFKTRLEFTAECEKALNNAGITIRDPRWNDLKTQAYNEYKIAELPIK